MKGYENVRYEHDIVDGSGEIVRDDGEWIAQTWSKHEDAFVDARRNGPILAAAFDAVAVCDEASVIVDTITVAYPDALPRELMDELVSLGHRMQAVLTKAQNVSANKRSPHEPIRP